ISLLDDQNSVQGNLIGTDISGTLAIGNQTGIAIRGANNVIGGPLPGSRNVIAGNVSSGIVVFGQTATVNVIQGNYVGTNVAGSAPLANGSFGIEIRGASWNTIGGAKPGEGNLISGNADSGVQIATGEFQ